MPNTKKVPLKPKATPRKRAISFSEMQDFIKMFNDMLCSEVVDSSLNFPGSEQKYKPVYDEHEQLVIKSKLFYLLNLLPGK
jgi:hypothetical protein